MGYRSDVTCLIYGSHDMVDSFIAQDKLKGEDSVFEGYFKKDYKIVDRGDVRVVMFEMEYVKWYVGYKDVDAFERMLNMVDVMNEEGRENESDWIAAEFGRIGEENEDIDCRTFGDEIQWYLSVERNLVVDI